MPSAMANSGAVRVALVQMCSGRDVAANVAAASALVREAAAAGATYVQTPEVTTLIEPDGSRLFAAVTPEHDRAAIDGFSNLARDLGLWLHIGSMAVRVAPDKVANRAFLFDPRGVAVATYDKIHMFDVSLPGGETYRESKNYRPGAVAPVVRTPWGKIGITICYDLRFPQIYRALAKAGAEILAIPSAFTVPTGAAHWHTLMRARAIENGCWILAAAQAGTHESGRKTYGHSLIISPWGEIVAEAPTLHPSVIMADVDLSAVADARRRIPSLQHDRPFEIDQLQADCEPEFDGKRS
ncbi:MAG: carbon-nitrogen hydrolase family protein [Hyphomicrobiaceae bacterium]